MLADLQRRYADRANFLAVYIREAHACDVWPVGDGLGVTAPKTAEERIGVAKRMLAGVDFGWNTVVDSIENHFEAKFAPWPYRYYIMSKEGELQYVAMPDSSRCEYCFVELEEVLLRLLDE